jgi:hypothetical protein
LNGLHILSFLDLQYKPVIMVDAIFGGNLVTLILGTARIPTLVRWSKVMANVKQGNLTRSPQWWKHLKDWKRVFWKSERQAQKKDIKNESKD